MAKNGRSKSKNGSHPPPQRPSQDPPVLGSSHPFGAAQAAEGRGAPDDGSHQPINLGDVRMILFQRRGRS